jgi:predicted patatin/cPLA2 family phospholipase
MQRYKEGDRTVKPILLVLGGAMKGVHSAAQLQALEELGYRDSFAAIGGISAGSGPAAFFAAGETRKAIKLFIEECTTSKFLNLSAKNLLPQNWKHILNLDVIKDFMETPGEKGLNTDTLANTETELFTIATNTSGKSDILDMKTTTHNGICNMIAGCVASASIPLFRPNGHEVNGQIYFDGSVSDLPLDTIIEHYDATSVLILSNHSLYDQDTYEQSSVDYIIQTIGKKLGKEGSLGSASSLGNTLGMQDNKSVIGKLAEYITKKAHSRHTLEQYAAHKQVKIGVHFSPPSGVGNLTTSPETFAAAMSDSYRDTYKKFSSASIAV